jgi:hypothetical protein
VRSPRTRSKATSPRSSAATMASTTTLAKPSIMDQYLREFDYRLQHPQDERSGPNDSTSPIKKTSGKRLTLKQPKGSTDSNDSVG